ncbi:MAG: hypothetical protein J7545_17795 [Roseofilum sp. SBFL]|nr:MULTISPECIES: hypothetical protein [unclassified Roseofilum]MBP0015688.1 hypothetical protein [Roseofilum sp. SID3]MBP0025393.1 hypothetical protein [Roseofilum sp. SID2]MBP0036830.1 hypothetical protein [Roseofilum sp. SID1]MBP0043801.1 hypothetical protein [Roseofilum sp. SBFL]
MNPPLMQSALQIATKVLPGDKVEIQVPSGYEGQEGEVLVFFPLQCDTPLTIEERVEKWSTFVQGLPNKSADLTAEALHQDSMYD